MRDPRTDQTDPSKIPSRTGLALVLFLVVIATAAAISYWVFRRAHPVQTSERNASIAQLQNSPIKLGIDILDGRL